MEVNCTFFKTCLEKMLLHFISNTIYKCLPKKFNFVNTYKPCLKKAEASEKTFPNYVAWSKIFVDYETTNNCQLCHFSEESVVGKTFHFIT